MLDCMLLGYIGSRVPGNLFWVDTPAPEGSFSLTNKFVGQLATLYYFVHFLIILPLARPARNAEADARIDLGSGAGQEQAGASRRKCRGAGRVSGENRT